jgi:tRNA/tmRNA/rRNA uracil-C5-methylase (TrmA/RlmC/RlmD family)
MFSCPHSNLCTACDLLVAHNSNSAREAHWRACLLEAKIPAPSELPILASSTPRLRCKMDFSIENSNIGLWSSKTQGIVDLPTCELLTPSLQSFYSEFRKIPFNFSRKASFRLRIGSDGQQRGLWLDLAHEDTNNFLSSPYVQEVIDLVGPSGMVEIGQRLKSLVLGSTGARAKLGPPVLHRWFETRVNHQMVPLSSYVGSFTQPSLITQSWILSHLESWLQEIQPRKVFEFGCGIGNWSLFLLNFANHLDVTESDRNSLTALKQNLLTYEKSANCRVLGSGFFQHQQVLSPDYDLVFLNPARSGVGRLTQGGQIQSRWLIYVSCYPETLIKDMRPLQETYRLREHALVDQFPGSSHYEVLTLWERKT